MDDSGLPGVLGDDLADGWSPGGPFDLPGTGGGMSGQIGAAGFWFAARGGLPVCTGRLVTI